MTGVTLFRLFALALVIIWIIQIVWAARKPVDWPVPRAERYGIPLTRNLYIMAGVFGILVGLAMFAGSFLFFP
jgi:hypothetical protein